VKKYLFLYFGTRCRVSNYRFKCSLENFSEVPSLCLHRGNIILI